MVLTELLKKSTRKLKHYKSKETERKPKDKPKLHSPRIQSLLNKCRLSLMKLKHKSQRLPSNWSTMNLKLLEMTSPKKKWIELLRMLENSLHHRKILTEPSQMLRVNLLELLKILRLLMPLELS